MIQHFDIQLSARQRGYHIITSEILNAIGRLPESGVLFLFIKHTSAAICINENADPDVLADFESIFNHIVPEHLPFLKHTIEGPDDMPAHIKAAMFGSSISIPIRNGKLDLGTWQGIYLCEFRNKGGSRKLTASIYS
ncbi:MAG: YjbQ family protein [Chitinophagia bacterium]|nr:YjbQ family protein [Chitinophagia bacterium]